MEDRTELLYNSLFESGDYTKSFEEFKAQFGNEEKVELLYESLNKSGKYTKSEEEFSNQFFPDVKKKDGTSESTVVEEGMESVSQPQPESGSSDVSAPQEPELDPYQDTPVTAPQEGEAVADPNLVALQEGESVYDANEVLRYNR